MTVGVGRRRDVLAVSDQVRLLTVVEGVALVAFGVEQGGMEPVVLGPEDFAVLPLGVSAVLDGLRDAKVVVLTAP